ncbi:hypothetical protein PanWU01x14_088140 [Parasponia andersonii]|uniref:Uncharacterized protein n=1 Tax=Parasponia andersonii TaxID=3476 RepID=A0A2P5D7U0_PARAD|nr:hypothetical protein PanWU01x14_088140 [Parasponia andersonii]
MHVFICGSTCKKSHLSRKPQHHFHPHTTTTHCLRSRWFSGSLTEVINGAIRHIYEADLRSGWGITWFRR